MAFGEWVVDQFVDNLLAMVLSFNSCFATLDTSAVDAFMQDWSWSTSLLVPLVGLIGRMLAHVIKCGVTAILVALWWEAHDWCPQVKQLVWPLGRAYDMAMPGPLGVFKLGKNLAWEWYNTYLVDCQQPLSVVKLGKSEV